MTTITFNKELYTGESVSAAAAAFQSLAKFNISDEQSYIAVSVSDCLYDEKQTLAEFGNYVIDFMNNNDGNN